MHNLYDVLGTQRTQARPELILAGSFLSRNFNILVSENGRRDKMNWKQKSKILTLFDYLPARLFFLLSKHILRSGSVNITAGGLPSAWTFVEETLKNAQAKTSIEFGAGRHLGINQWFSQFMDKQVVVDIDRMIDIDLVRQTNEDLRKHGYLDQTSIIETLQNLDTDMGIDYRAPCDLLDVAEDEEFDVSFSVSTWEHIPQSVIPVLLVKLKSLLKPGGLIVAHIDYSDHYAHSDSALDRLHFLAYSEAEWAQHNHRHLFQNRLRHQHYQKIFDDCGLKTITADASNYVRSPKLPAIADNLTGHETDYATTGRWVLQV